MKYFILFLFCLFFTLQINAQIPDSIQEIIDLPTVDSTILTSTPKIESIVLDTTQIKTSFFNKFLKSDYPNPKKAALLSIIPGGGQIYNKKWWKLPLVYGAYGGMTYLLIYNKSRKKSYDAAYATRLELKDLPACDALCLTLVNSSLSVESIKARRTSQNKNLQLSYIGIVATVILAAADSFVDAHLKNFDVSEDLTIQFKPTFSGDQIVGTSFGVGVSLRWK